MGTYIQFLFLLVSIGLCNCVQRISLNGEWSAIGADPELTVTATVPGGIFSDLMENDQIGDIFSGKGDSDYAWVGETNWTYTRAFEVTEELLAFRVVSLVFEGLDTFAAISINGVEVGTSENMFVRYVFNINDQLKVGSNDITVQFTSAVKKAAALAEDPNNSYVIPPECPVDEYKGICHANRIRKMQASFSWDWGPAFASVGIWKNVYLQAFDTAVIDYVVATPLKNPDRDVWTLKITTYFDAGKLETVSGTLNVTLDLESTSQSVVSEIQISRNEYNEVLVTMSMEVDSTLISVWWPNGYGTQKLYNLNVAFSTDTAQDEKTVRIGFRTIEVIQDELDTGLTFYFKVNGYPLFLKGANEIPLNILPEKGQDPAVVQTVLQAAKDVHMNMLRVWGGGVYESDYFYDLADEYGILIWQDFMFACAMYPADEAYLSNVAKEVRHQLKRLGSHPSIVIWSGNNENEGALRDNWYDTEDQFEVYKQDYIKLYVDLIQTEVERILPNINFVTSSPTNGLQTDREDHVAQHPGDPLYGDVHFYNYVNDSWSVNIFPTPRFASEYGYQSMPSLESWLTVTDDVNDVHPNGSFLDYRQHHPDGNNQNTNLIKIELDLPDPSSDNYIKTFIYYSQIIQAQAIKIETEHYRSFKGRLDEEGKGYTMGALYWQLNDVWVAPTWSGMDFMGRWKMLHYAALDFFNPMIVTGVLNNDQLEIYAVLDALEVPEFPVKALMHIYKWESLEPLVAIEYPVTLSTTEAVLVTTVDAPTALATAGCGSNYAAAKANCFFHIHLMDMDNNHLVPFNHIFPEKLKNSNLATPNVGIGTITEIDKGKMFEIVVTTDAVAPFVWLDTHEIKGRFSANGFLHVLPTRTVQFMAEEPVSLEDFKAALTVTYLGDPSVS